MKGSRAKSTIMKALISDLVNSRSTSLTNSDHLYKKACSYLVTNYLTGPWKKTYVGDTSFCNVFCLLYSVHLLKHHDLMYFSPSVLSDGHCRNSGPNRRNWQLHLCQLAQQCLLLGDAAASPRAEEAEAGQSLPLPQLGVVATEGVDIPLRPRPPTNQAWSIWARLPQ